MKGRGVGWSVVEWRGGVKGRGGMEWSRVEWSGV